MILPIERKGDGRPAYRMGKEKKKEEGGGACQILRKTNTISTSLGL